MRIDACRGRALSLLLAMHVLIAACSQAEHPFGEPFTSSGHPMTFADAIELAPPANGWRFRSFPNLDALQFAREVSPSPGQPREAERQFLQAEVHSLAAARGAPERLLRAFADQKRNPPDSANVTLTVATAESEQVKDASCVRYARDERSADDERFPGVEFVTEVRGLLCLHAWQPIFIELRAVHVHTIDGPTLDSNDAAAFLGDFRFVGAGPPAAPSAPSRTMTRTAFSMPLLDRSSGPEPRESDTTRTRYAPEGLEVDLAPGRFYRYYSTQEKVRDVRVEVSATLLKGVGAIGVICRVQGGDVANYYYATIDSNQNWGIWRVRSTAKVLATSLVREPSILRQGLNRIGLDCVGGPAGVHIALILNSSEVAVVYDATPGALSTAGYAGFFVNASGEERVSTVLRDLIVSELSVN